MPQICLIAAHDPWFIQLLRIYSEESGFRVIQAHEGQDVLPMVQEVHPGVVLLQVDLPGQVKGWEILNTMNQDPQLCHIPVLVFSWHTFEHEEEVSKYAAAYLQEPVTYETFTEALQRAGLR